MSFFLLLDTCKLLLVEQHSSAKAEIKQRLEEDANQVLQFMASNGLIANQAKTEFMVLNEKDKNSLVLKSLTVGNAVIERTKHTKLLGVIIEESQEWTEHFKTLKTSLNQRLWVIRRIARQLPKSKLMTVVHSLWMSKLRYGLQLCIKVRLVESDVKPNYLKSLQQMQNRISYGEFGDMYECRNKS